MKDFLFFIFLVLVDIPLFSIHVMKHFFLFVLLQIFVFLHVPLFSVHVMYIYSLGLYKKHFPLFCLFNFCVSACTPVFYSCYVHLFCRSEQSVSSLNICTADSPPHTGLDNTYQLLYFICISFSFYLYFIVSHFVQTFFYQFNGDSPPQTGLDNTYQLLYSICISFTFLFVFHCFAFFFRLLIIFAHWTGHHISAFVFHLYFIV